MRGGVALFLLPFLLIILLYYLTKPFDNDYKTASIAEMEAITFIKDVNVSKEIFEQGYPHIETFRQYRKENKMDEKFQSLQSKRVGI